jgi:CO dehydrogenase maturation factor
MRIAFVGKGGSGKTTLSALFAQYINKKYTVLAIDADLNMHLGPLLGFEDTLPLEQHISHPEASKTIKTYLKGKNHRIKDLAQFRKTTPPTKESNLLFLNDAHDPILVEFGAGDGNLRLLVVGTYAVEEIGANCYHNNLAILENILSHLIDARGIVVADMVAGVDAFANTLHAQFDLLVLTVEPTKRGIEVFEQYKKLAEEAGVYELLFVVGNKVRYAADEEFINKHIPENKLLGFFRESEYLRRKDQEGGAVNPDLLEEENKKLLHTIAAKLFSIKPDYKKRLEKLFELHRRYVAQGFIRDRYGDLTNHIDPTFDLEMIFQNHANNKHKK